MRVLIDESLPLELVDELALSGTRAVTALGWSGLTNGGLLQRAETAGFRVLLTADRSLPYQQNVGQSGIAVIVLRARSNRIEDLRPLIPGIRQALSIIAPGQVLRLGN